MGEVINLKEYRLSKEKERIKSEKEHIETLKETLRELTKDLPDIPMVGYYPKLDEDRMIADLLLDISLGPCWDYESVETIPLNHTNDNVFDISTAEKPDDDIK